jgi:trigger factor
LNIRTERLENHSLRMVVEVEPTAFEEAKRSALRTISGKLNIPGFRKGKAPAAVVTRYVGEAYILEEAIESLGQKLYREALEQSQVEPAAPGSMDDFTLEPQPTFTYTVPLAPEVVLGDYRSVRVDFKEAEVTDEDVESELRGLQRELSVATPREDGAQIGDRITADIHSFFVEAEAESDTETDVHDRTEEAYFHRHGAVVSLLEGDDEPLAPGFSQNVVGMKAGESRTFRLTISADHDKANPDLVGRTIEFVVGVTQVEQLELPEMDSEFAKDVSARYGWEKEVEATETAETEEAAPEAAEDTPAVEAVSDEVAETELADDSDEDEAEENFIDSLDEVRVRLKVALIEREEKAVRERYANSVLEKIIENAEVKFNDVSVESEIDDMIEDLKERLRQNRLDLDTYLKQTGRTIEEVRGDYREPASRFLRRSLVVREFATAEKLLVSEADINERLLSVFGGIDPQMIEQMGLLRDQRFLNNMINNLMSQKIEERAAAIGKGEAPELDAAPAVEETKAVVEEKAADEAEG